MKATIARIFAALALVLLLAIAGFYASIFAAAAHNRYIASKLLIRIRELKPGQTSEAEARLLLKPFDEYEDRYSDNAFEYAFSNVAPWEGRLLGKLPMETAADLTPLP